MSCLRELGKEKVSMIIGSFNVRGLGDSIK